jgi:glutamate dehydrogenase
MLSRLRAGKAPDALAHRLAHLPILARSTDVVLIADSTGRTIADAATSFFAIGGRFGFGRLDAMLGEIVTGDYYESLALQKARDSLEGAHRDLARSLVTSGHGPADLSEWAAAASGRIAATIEQVEKILAEPRPSIAKATVAASLLSELARG